MHTSRPAPPLPKMFLPESLAIARGRQVVKEGWVKERKKK